MGNIIINSDISSIKSLGENNRIENCVFIGDEICIGNNNTLINVIIKSNVNITDSFIDSAQIGSGTKIGPYSRIRPHTFIGKNCKIGNFVEIKNSRLLDGVKIGHLAYVGDTLIGENTNIGCGVVFANYNGKVKSKSYVGKNCFVGSNVNVVAPVDIADDTYICAGTTITCNTSEGDFVIGRLKAKTNDKYKFYIKNVLNK